jgi:hypothetical protein
VALAADARAGGRHRRRLVTAYLAVVSNDGLVEDDYYKQG